MNFFLEKAYAAEPDFSGVDSLIGRINNQILTPLIYFVFALAIFWFILGMIVYIRNAESPEKRQEGYTHMIWAVIGLFIMISVKGIINLVLNTFF